MVVNREPEPEYTKVVAEKNPEVSNLTGIMENKEAMKVINTMGVNTDMLENDPDAFFKKLEEASGGEIQCIPLPPVPEE